MSTSTTYEYEERAFLDERSFLNTKNKLDTVALKSQLDNKTSYFFVLPDINVSIASSSTKAVVKYKGGQLGKGNGFEEHEFRIVPDSLPEALALFTTLLKIDPQVSEQFRINYFLEDNIEVALKYTQTWGFHLEVEKTYTAKDTTEEELKKAEAMKSLDSLAKELDIHYITDSEMEQFKQDSEAGKSRGAYTPSEFSDKYGALFT